jgi:hypothetical protein
MIEEFTLPFCCLSQPKYLSDGGCSLPQVYKILYRTFCGCQHTVIFSAYPGIRIIEDLFRVSHKPSFGLIVCIDWSIMQC